MTTAHLYDTSGSQVQTTSMAPARFMFAFDAVTAGALGTGLLLAPEQVGQLLLGAAQDPVTARLVGAVFAGFAIVSVPGIKDPERYLPLLLAQGAYKTLWLATTVPGLPALVSERPAAAGMAVSFLVYLTGYAVALHRAGWPTWLRRSAQR